MRGCTRLQRSLTGWGIARQRRHPKERQRNAESFPEADSFSERDHCNGNAHDGVQTGDRRDHRCFSISREGSEKGEISQTESESQRDD